MTFSTRVNAQEISLKDMPLYSSVYLENAFHPGLKVGSYITVWDKTKTRTFRGLKRQEKLGTQTKLKELNLNFNLGFYNHVNNHFGTFISSGTTFLRTKTRKMRQLGVSLDLGYLRRFYKFETVQLSEDGNIESIPNAGNNAFFIDFGLIIGREFQTDQFSFRPFIKPTLQLQHYSYTVVPNAILEIGTVFNIKRNSTDE